MDDLYSVAQVAERLKMHRSRVAALCADDKIHALRVGRAWLIPAAELARFAENRPKLGRPVGTKNKPKPKPVLDA